MELRQLRYFVTIADCGSLSKAGLRLRVAQPALSIQMASLEAECGSKLFDRHHRGVSLTNSGRILLRHAETILRGVNDASEALRSQAATVDGQVSLGVPTTVTDLFVGRLIAEMQEKHPQIRLRLLENSSGVLAEMLAEGILDLSILMNSQEDQVTNSHPLLIETYCVVSPPGAAPQADETIRWSDVLRLPLLLPGPGSLLRHMLEEAALQAGYPLRSVADLDSSRLLLAAVRAGVAHTVLPLSSVADERSRRDFVVRTITHPTVSATLHLSRSSIRPATPAQAAVKSLTINLAHEFVLSGRWHGHLHGAIEEPTSDAPTIPSC